MATGFAGKYRRAFFIYRRQCFIIKIAYKVYKLESLQYGMYAAFMGPFVYVLLGSVPAVTDGPTTLMALMTQKYAIIHPGYAPLLALCNGVVILACGVLRLGKWYCLIALSSYIEIQSVNRYMHVHTYLPICVAVRIPKSPYVCFCQFPYITLRLFLSVSLHHPTSVLVSIPTSPYVCFVSIPTSHISVPDSIPTYITNVCFCQYPYIKL